MCPNNVKYETICIDKMEEISKMFKVTADHFVISSLQGGPGCEYCRITTADVKKALGFKSTKPFGSKSDNAEQVPREATLTDLLRTEQTRLLTHVLRVLVAASNPNSITPVSSSLTISIH